MCDMDPASTAAGVQYPPPTYMKETLPPSHLMQGQPPAYTAPNTAAQSVPTQAAVHYDPNLQNIAAYHQPPPPAQNVIVVQQQPASTPNIVTVENTPVVTDNYLTMSWILLVFTTFFLCLWVWPCAFTALALSNMARDAQRKGEEDTAKNMARGSLGCNIATIVTLLLGILAVIITGSVLGTSSSSSSSYSYYYGYYSYSYYYYY